MGLRKFTSTGWIIFWMIIFWPFGLVCLVLRVTGYYDNSANADSTDVVITDANIYTRPGEKYLKRNTVLLVIGLLFLFVGVSANFLSGVEAGEGVPALFLGVMLLLFYVKRRKTYDKYKKYIDYLNNYSVTTFRDMASGLSESESTVRVAISEMIQKKILFADIVNGEKVVLYGQHDTPAEPAQPRRVVKCPGCGAYGEVIPGDKNRCEYCGTPLQ